MTLKEFIINAKRCHPDWTDRDISDAIETATEINSYYKGYGTHITYIGTVLVAAGLRAKKVRSLDERTAIDLRNWRIYWARIKGAKYAELAKQYGLSLERIRQIVMKKARDRKVMSEERDVPFLLSVLPREVCRVVSGLDFGEVRVIRDDADLEPTTSAARFYPEFPDAPPGDWQGLRRLKRWAHPYAEER